MTLAEAKQENAEDTREILKESKGNGFDPKALRAVVKLQMEDADKILQRENLELIIDTYRRALGQLATTPLGHCCCRALVRVNPCTNLPVSSGASSLPRDRPAKSRSRGL